MGPPKGTGYCGRRRRRLAWPGAALFPSPPLKPKLRFAPAAAVAHLRASDSVLAALMDEVGPYALELQRTTSLFEALLRSIVYQQLHANAANAIHGRVLEKLKKHGGARPEALGKVSDAALRGAGLSRNKLLAIRDLAAKCLAGTVPSLREARRLGDDELVARLTEVRGIGPWTGHMLLIFHLGRPGRDADRRLGDSGGLQEGLSQAPGSAPRGGAQARPAVAAPPLGRELVFLWRSLDSE